MKKMDMDTIDYNTIDFRNIVVVDIHIYLIKKHNTK